MEFSNKIIYHSCFARGHNLCQCQPEILSRVMVKTCMFNFFSASLSQKRHIIIAMKETKTQEAYMPQDFSSLEKAKYRNYKVGERNPHTRPTFKRKYTAQCQGTLGTERSKWQAEHDGRCQMSIGNQIQVSKVDCSQVGLLMARSQNGIEQQSVPQEAWLAKN